MTSTQTAVASSTPLRAWKLTYTGQLPMNQNGSDSPWRKREDRTRWRVNAQALAGVAEPSRMPQRELIRVRISGTIFRRNLLVADRPGDLERLKSVIDGLVQGKFLPDDGPRFVEYGEVGEAHGVRGFTLLIEELEHDADTATRAARRYTRGDALEPLEAVRRRARSRGRAPAPQRTPTAGEAAARRPRDRKRPAADDGRPPAG